MVSDLVPPGPSSFRATGAEAVAAATAPPLGGRGGGVWVAAGEPATQPMAAMPKSIMAMARLADA